MNTTQAKQAGIVAYKAGKGRAPALNMAFLEAASASGKLVAMMEAYSEGWTLAMLADGCEDENMPSVKAVKALMS